MLKYLTVDPRYFATIAAAENNFLFKVDYLTV